MNTAQTIMSGSGSVGVPFLLTQTLSLPAFAALRRGPAVLRVASKRSEDGGERGQLAVRSDYSATRVVNPVAGISLKRSTFLPLLGERAGVRAGVTA